MGQTFGDRIRFLVNVFALSCVIAAYWMVVPVAARFIEAASRL